MNDDELERRLRDYGPALDRAAASVATDRVGPIAPLDVVGDRRRRRNALRAVASVVAAAAAAVGVLALATRDGDESTSDGNAPTTAVPVASSSMPATTVPVASSTTTPSSSSAPPPSSSTPTATSIVDDSTTTTAVDARAPLSCAVADITRDTGVELAGMFGTCHAGWVLGVAPGCGSDPDPATDGDGECESAEAFYVTDVGWEHVGAVYPFCVESLPGDTGMTVQTAFALGATVCDPSSSIDPAAVPATLRTGDSSTEVRALQIALVYQGYTLVADGDFGPATVAAVRDFQSLGGLEADGVAGPDTRAALEV